MRLERISLGETFQAFRAFDTGLCSLEAKRSLSQGETIHSLNTNYEQLVGLPVGSRQLGCDMVRYQLN